MWIGVLWAGLRVTMWITHVGGQFCHGPARKVTERIKGGGGYRSSKWHDRQRQFIFEFIMHFIADTDTDKIILELILGSRNRHQLFFAAWGGTGRSR